MGNFDFSTSKQGQICKIPTYPLPLYVFSFSAQQHCSLSSLSQSATVHHHRPPQPPSLSFITIIILAIIAVLSIRSPRPTTSCLESVHPLLPYTVRNPFESLLKKRSPVPLRTRTRKLSPDPYSPPHIRSELTGK